MHIRLDDKEIAVPSHFTPDDDPVDDDEDNVWDEDEMTTFTFGFALTVHKSQGSEWDNALIIDEMPHSKPDWRKWAYTAITRAAKQVLIAR